MSRRDDQGGWQWREEVKLIVRNSPLNGFHYPLRSRCAELLVSGSQIIFLIDQKNSLQKRAEVIFFEDVHEFFPQQTRQVMKNLLELAWAPTSKVSLVGVFWFNQHFLTVHFCQDQATAMPVDRIWDPLS